MTEDENLEQSQDSAAPDGASQIMAAPATVVVSGQVALNRIFGL